MTYEKHRPLFRGLLDKIIELMFKILVKAVKRLVQKQEPRVECKCAGKRDATFHAAAQLVRISVLLVFHTNTLHPRIRNGPVLYDKVDVVRRRHPWDQPVLLKNDGCIFGIRSIYAARIRQDQSGQQEQEGCFSAAGRTE